METKGELEEIRCQSCGRMLCKRGKNHWYYFQHKSKNLTIAFPYCLIRCPNEECKEWHFLYPRCPMSVSEFFMVDPEEFKYFLTT